MNDVKEEIRDRLDIENVIGDYVELKRAGRNFKALSPFSNEKTPSFVVSPDKRIWHDFSSGKGGDVFSFIMEMEGVGFREALKILARKAGVELKDFDNKKSQALAKQKSQIIKINQLSTRFFQAVLAHNQHALEYAKENRKLTDKTIKDFAIGYAPNNGKALVEFLQKKKFKIAEIVDAGLTNQYKSDLFKGRLMIPLSDAMGQVIGYTGRALDNEMMPKYLNTPATLVYDKSRHVFGLFQAKESIRKLNQVVIVEGNMDVISSHQVGIKNVVATAGTAMTEQHLKILNRYTGDIRLSFDSDDAGIKAVERAIELSQKVGVDLKIVTLLGEAKDPDELIQQDVKKWQQSINQAKPAIDWLIDNYSKKYNRSPEGKRDFVKAILKVVSKINDEVEKEAYLVKISEHIEIPLEIIKQRLNEEVENEKAPKKTKKLTKKKVKIDQTKFEDDLLAIALNSEEIRLKLPEIKDLFTATEQKPRQKLAEILIENAKDFDKKCLSNLQDLTVYAKVLTLKAEERYLSWPKNDLETEGKRLIDRLKQSFQKQGKDKLMEQLRQAELDGDEKKASQILAEINQITKGESK